MDGMVVVALAGGCVGEFHSAAEFVVLAPGRDVETNPGFENFRDLVFEFADFREHVIFLGARDIGFEPKREHVDKHGE